MLIQQIDIRAEISLRGNISGMTSHYITSIE